MTTELVSTQTSNRSSPESWRTYGKCSIYRRTVIEDGQNPYLIDSSSREDAEAALREARQWLAPAPREAILALLSELYLKTAKAGSTDDDFKARLSVYARDLGAYPADVLRDTLRGWRGTWFPTFDELASAIERDWRIRERRTRIKAFELFLSGRQDEKPKGKAVTREFIEQMRAKYRTPEVEEAAQLTPEQFEMIKRVDEQFGDAAKAKNGKWRPLSEVAKLVVMPVENASRETFPPAQSA